MEGLNFPVNGAGGVMRAGQVADAHQELAHDLAAGEPEGVPKQLDPFGLGQRMMRLEPARERAVRAPQLENLLGVRDRRVDLELVADDAGVGEQTAPVARAVRGHDLGIESVVCPAEALALLEDGEPGEPGLIDLEHEPLEQPRIIREREAVLGVVVGSVPFMARSNVAVAHAGLDSGVWTAAMSKTAASWSSRLPGLQSLAASHGALAECSCRRFDQRTSVGPGERRSV